MSDLFYRDAVTEDGEPVAVTEADWANPTDTAGAHAGTRPCSWALILPGDTVRFIDPDDRTHRTGTIEIIDRGWDHPDEITVFTEPNLDTIVYPAGLTLVCGSPENNPHRFGDNTNPAWRWD